MPFIISIRTTAPLPSLRLFFLPKLVGFSHRSANVLSDPFSWLAFCQSSHFLLRSEPALAEHTLTSLSRFSHLTR